MIPEEEGEKPEDAPNKENVDETAEKPAEENKEKDGSDEFEYKIAREYHWTVKAKASKGYEQENYFVVS